jgi:tRNA(His) guanylyltransferase
LFERRANVYQRRSSKIISAISSLFTSAFVMQWTHFKPRKLEYPPSFDARAVCYPTFKNIRDYFSWRQADCHINNLYNTCFWKLVDSGKTETDAETLLNGTFSSQKNELLFSQFNINYNNIEDVFKKGSVLFRTKKPHKEITKDSREIERLRPTIECAYVDLISDDFWQQKELSILTEEV